MVNTVPFSSFHFQISHRKVSHPAGGGWPLLTPELLLPEPLGSNTHMITDRVPQGRLLTHVVLSGQGILDGVGERVAQVQGTCHIWG